MQAYASLDRALARVVGLSKELAMELWRVARLVVDSGLHEQQWTRERWRNP